MKKVLKALLAAVLTVSMLMAVTGCNKPTTTASHGLITLNFLTYISGTHGGAQTYQASVDRFNKKYDGVYKVVIQEIGQDPYDDKIKQLAVAHQLPTLMYNMHDTNWLINYVAKNSISLDLTSWFNKNPDVKKLCVADSLKYCTFGGRVDFMPEITSSPIGTFYNSALYQPSGPISQMTVDKFQSSLSNNKIAFMTGENAWTTQLLFSALIANQSGGAAILKSHVVSMLTDFSDPAIVNAATQLQSFLQKNASSNTVGAAYADADNNFLSNSSAVICNGPWALTDFDATQSQSKWSNGFDGSKVKADIYPGDVALSNNSIFGEYWISNAASADQKEAALAFMGFEYSTSELEQHILSNGGMAPNLPLTDEFKQKMANTPILQSYMAAFDSKTIYVPYLDQVIYPSVAQPGLPNVLPDLISGKLTPKAFCDKLTALSLTAKNGG
jgi:raffinose/stachyose/melibiose transport system substrate-binding protein